MACHSSSPTKTHPRSRRLGSHHRDPAGKVGTPRAGRKPHRLVAKSGSEKKRRRASWAPRRRVLQTVAEPNPQNPARARFARGANQYPEAGFSFPMKTPFRRVF